jgi:hypothetical protein
MNDDLESRLRKSGEAERWTLPPWPDPMTRLTKAMHRRQTRRRAVAAAGASLSVGGLAIAGANLLPHHDATGTVLATSSSSTPAQSVASCPPTALALTTLSDSVVAGHVETTFGLENTGEAPCTTSGYPHLTVLSSSGAVIAVDVHYTDHGFSRPVGSGKPVQLGPGDSARFDVAMDSTFCGGTGGPLEFLEFSPPGATGDAQKGTVKDGTVKRGIVAKDFAPCAGQPVYVSPVYQ